MERTSTSKTGAQHQAAYRARKGRQIAVFLPDDVKAGLDAYLERRRMNGDPDATMSSVIAKLLSSQLLRER